MYLMMTTDVGLCYVPDVGSAEKELREESPSIDNLSNRQLASDSRFGLLFLILTIL